MFKKSASTLGLALLSLFFLFGQAMAQERPFQLSLVGPTLQLVDDDADIKGLRLNLIYGVNENVTGLDLGLINRTRGDFKGLQHGLIGLTDGDFKGWQNHAINVVDQDLLGLQSGLVNVTGMGEGVQWGFAFNSAQYMSGLQISLVNFAEDMHGIQLGLINIIRSKDDLPILPLVNWKFD